MKLYWLDLETTGLDPYSDDVLEISVSEAELETPFDAKPIYQAVTRHNGLYLTPFIQETHTKNGLLAECAESSNTEWMVERDLLDLIPPAPTREDLHVLAGNSIHFDHAFLKTSMPDLAARFSHRHYDVSAVMLFARSLGMPKLPKAEAHRAADDVLESIQLARQVAEWFRIRLAL